MISVNENAPKRTLLNALNPLIHKEDTNRKHFHPNSIHSTLLTFIISIHSLSSNHPAPNSIQLSLPLQSITPLIYTLPQTHNTHPHTIQLNPSNTNSRTPTNSLSQTSYRFTHASLIPMLRLAYNEPQFNSTEMISDNPLTTKEPILPNDSLPTSIHSTLLHFSPHNSLFNELPHSHLQSQSSPLTTNFFTLTSLTLITSTLFTFRTILGSFYDNTVDEEKPRPVRTPGFTLPKRSLSTQRRLFAPMLKLDCPFTPTNPTSYTFMTVMG